jgi:hypothetical protein
VLAKVPDTIGGELAAVLAGHQLNGDLAEVLVDPCDAGEQFAVALDHWGSPPLCFADRRSRLSATSQDAQRSQKLLPDN